MLVLAAFLLAQTVLTWFARRASFVLSEQMFAELREDFMHRVLALPLSTVERAGTGDLVSRTTADVAAMERTVRFAVPETLIAAVTTVLTVVAAVWVSPPAALACLAGVLPLVVGTRWYLRRAPAGYLWERAAYAKLAGTVGETVEGGRTIEALGLREEFVRRLDADLEDAVRAEKRTLYLRTVWFPTAEFAYVLPVAAALAWGGWLVSAGHASIGEVTAIALYVVQLADPVDRLISWLDEIQVGATSFARLVGIAAVPPDRTATDDVPDDERLRAEDVRYAYVAERDVLHGIDLDLEPGERVAIVGPSGAGKSTLGRLLAGIHPPRRGRVDIGGVRLVDLPLETPAAGSRARDAGAAPLRRHARREPPARAGRTPRTTSFATHWRRSTHSSGPTRFRTNWRPSSARAATPSRPPRRSRSRSHASCSPTRTRSCSTRRRRCSTRARHVISSARSRPSCAGGRSSPSRTACTPRTTPTASPSSRRAGCKSSARTTSSSATAARTPRSGTPGTATARRTEPKREDVHWTRRDDRCILIHTTRHRLTGLLVFAAIAAGIVLLAVTHNFYAWGIFGASLILLVVVLAIFWYRDSGDVQRFEEHR